MKLLNETSKFNQLNGFHFRFIDQNRSNENTSISFLRKSKKFSINYKGKTKGFIQNKKYRSIFLKRWKSNLNFKFFIPNHKFVIIFVMLKKIKS